MISIAIHYSRLQLSALYRVPVKATADGEYPIQRMLYHTCVYEDVPDYTATASRDSALAALEERARAGGWTYIDIEAKLYGKTDEEAEAAVLSEDIGLTGPTGAAEAAAVTDPTETAAPASGDDVCSHCVCRECDDANCLQAYCDCRDRGAGCIKPDDDCRHDHPELFPEADKQVDARRPTSSAAATAAVVTAAEVPAHADAANTMAEPAASLSEQTDDADGSALATSTGSAPAVFDYSGLTEQDVADLHLAEREYSAGKKMAEIGLRRMADGVAIAHDTLCGTVVAQCDNGKFAKKEDTFRAWCASVGIGKDTAYRLLQVSALFDHSSPNEQKLLDGLPATLLYAAAKPNAPAEAVEAVKAGDVTTMPEYKALLAELNRVKHEAELDRKECENTNAQADRLLAERNAMNQEVIRLHDADRRAEAAERRAESIEAQRRNLQEAEAAHAAKIRELESRPVDVAVRKPTDAEIERYRQEGYAKAQKEFAARRDDESDFCETIADHAEAVADSCAEALAGWFRLAADIDDAAYAAGAEHIKALWLALREALQSGAWPTDDLDDDDDDEEYDPDDDDEENSDE